MTRPWTDQLRDSCIQAALADAPGATVIHVPDAVEKILDHLAEMRMLLPPGAQTRERWRVVYTDPQDGKLTTWTHIDVESRDEAEARLRSCARYWHTARLQRRRWVVWPDGAAWMQAFTTWENIP